VIVALRCVRAYGFVQLIYSFCIYLLQNACIGHFRNAIILFVRPSKTPHKHCFHFLLRLTMVPRENKSNTHAKCWRDKQRALWHFLKWPTALSLHKQVHVTLYKSLIVCHSVFVYPENFICSCLLKHLVLVNVWITLCDVYTNK